MAQTQVYNISGTAVGTIELRDDIFAVKVNPALVQAVAVAQRANRAGVYAHTKNRADVRGGGRKPWRQKGTGRARQGSIRSPQWKGGGVVFGPRSNRNQAKKVNQKTRQKAIRMMLSDKVGHQHLIVVDSFEDLAGKTREIAQLLQTLPVVGNSTLIATAAVVPQLKRAAANLQTVNTVLADSVNVGDLLRYQLLILDRAGVEKLAAHFGTSATVSTT